MRYAYSDKRRKDEILISFDEMAINNYWILVTLFFKEIYHGSSMSEMWFPQY